MSPYRAETAEVERTLHHSILALDRGHTTGGDVVVRDLLNLRQRAVAVRCMVQTQLTAEGDLGNEHGNGRRWVWMGRVGEV